MRSDTDLDLLVTMVSFKETIHKSLKGYGANEVKCKHTGRGPKFLHKNV
jgi:hypothetical protein